MKRRALCIVEDLENRGDALIALVETNFLRTRSGYETVQVATWEQPPVPVETDLGGQDVAATSIRLGPARFLRSCCAADLYVGGGNMLRPDVSRRWLVTLIAGLTLCRLFGGTATCVGIGAVHGEKGIHRVLWATCLMLCSKVHAREERSAQIVRDDHPLIASRVDVTTDVVFVDDIPSRPHDPERRTCIVAPAFDRSEGRTVEAPQVVRLVEELARTGRITHVVLVAHDPRPHMDGDLCMSLAAELQSSGVDIRVVLPDGPSALLDEYAKADLVVTSRLHGLILGALHALPVLRLPDVSNKMAPFGIALGYPAMNFAEAESGRAFVEIETYLQDFDRAALKRRVENLRRHAVGNFPDALPVADRAQVR